MNRSMSGPGFRKSRLDGIELCDWFDEGVDQLLNVLGSVDHQTECPNFNPGSPSQAGFWYRRQLHETVVHRWDVERALDCETTIDSITATDGIDEYLDVFVRTRGKQTLIAPLGLTADTGRSWTLSPAAKPGRIDIAHGRSSVVAANIAGPPAALLLLLWGRQDLSETDLSIEGDTAVATSLRG